MNIVNEYSLHHVTMDKLNEYGIVLGKLDNGIYLLRLNTNGRWIWENIIVQGSFYSGIYVSRPEAINGFSGKVEAFKNKESAYLFLREAILNEKF